MGFCHLSYLGQNTLFPALNSHLQLILELVIVLCVASTLSAIPDSRTKQSVSLFSQMLRGLNPHPASPKHCPSFCDTGTMSSQCIFAFSSCWICVSPPHLLVQELQGTRSLPSWEDITELSPGRPSAARFLSKEDSLCPDSNMIFPPIPGTEAGPPLSTCCENTFNICCVSGESLLNPAGL